MKKMRLAAAGLALYGAAAGLYFSRRIMYIKKKEESLITEREIAANRLDLNLYERLPKEQVYTDSPSGYQLDCVYVEPHDSDYWVVICHGVTENKMNSIKYMNIFLQLGFNAVIYDHRRHGGSGGKTTTYGHSEKQDLKAVIDELKRRKGNDIILGIHGESMGAASMLLYAGMIEDGADFYIADCPFSDFDELLKHQVKEESGLPWWAVLPFGKLAVRVLDGYWTSAVSPIQYIEQIQNPVLFIHSQEDTYIPPQMSRELFEKKQGPKRIFLPEKGAHAQSYNENPACYQEEVAHFLKEHGFLPFGGQPHLSANVCSQ